MKLLTQWNPEVSPPIPNPYGVEYHRLVAVLKDGVGSYYVCFYDSHTSKVYVEEISKAALGGGKQSYTVADLWQISSDVEWLACIECLKNNQVLELIETNIQAGMTGIQLSKELFKLPRAALGCDAIGRPITGVLSRKATISPSLL